MQDTQNVGLLSLDLGSVYTADGRDHPITGLTPLQQIGLPELFSSAADIGQQPTQTSTTSSQSPWDQIKQGGSFWGLLQSLFGIDANTKRNLAIRFVLIALAVILLAIAVFRLTE